MSDAFLALAQTEAGLSCFLVPRWRPDGTRNAIRIVRLKDKLGDRSNASSEIELDGATGRLIGGDGEGVRTKRAAAFAAEALECLGGNGYVEESPLPRLFRQSPLNGIWEGSGNVIALDTLRAIERHPAALAAVFAELDEARGFDERLDRKVLELKHSTNDLGETNARHFVESMAIAFQAAILARTAPAFVAEAFVQARLGGDRSYTYGAASGDIDTGALIARALPV